MAHIIGMRVYAFINGPETVPCSLPFSRFNIDMKSALFVILIILTEEIRNIILHIIILNIGFFFLNQFLIKDNAQK